MYVLTTMMLKGTYPALSIALCSSAIKYSKNNGISGEQGGTVPEKMLYIVLSLKL